MTPEQVQIMIREEIIRLLGNYAGMPLEVENAFIARGFAKIVDVGAGALISSGDGTFSTVVGISNSGYVASVSGGSPTVLVQFTDGIKVT